MPITKAAKKALRNAKNKHEHNLKIKKNLKNAIKKASAKNLSEVVSTIDKAAKKHIIHKNKAARIKSALAKKFPVSVKAGKTKKAKKIAKKSTKKTSKKKK